MNISMVQTLTSIGLCDDSYEKCLASASECEIEMAIRYMEYYETQRKKRSAVCKKELERRKQQRMKTVDE